MWPEPTYPNGLRGQAHVFADLIRRQWFWPFAFRSVSRLGCRAFCSATTRTPSVPVSAFRVVRFWSAPCRPFCGLPRRIYLRTSGLNSPILRAIGPIPLANSPSYRQAFPPPLPRRCQRARSPRLLRDGIARPCSALSFRFRRRFWFFCAPWPCTTAAPHRPSV